MAWQWLFAKIETRPGVQPLQIFTLSQWIHPECVYSVNAIYRLFFALACFFGLMSLIMIDVQSSRDCRAGEFGCNRQFFFLLNNIRRVCVIDVSYGVAGVDRVADPAGHPTSTPFEKYTPNLTLSLINSRNFATPRPPHP